MPAAGNSPRLDRRLDTLFLQGDAEDVTETRLKSACQSQGRVHAVE